jgi:4-amino-4-deoxy-L-arabinose transferase-like glycosyltransferase
VLKPTVIPTRAAPRRSLGALAAPALLLLTVLGMWLGAAAGRPGMAFTAADPAAERALARFHDAERNATDSFRWSQPRAAIFLYGFQGEPARLSLRLAGPRAPEAAPASLSLTVADQALGTFAVAPDWRRYHVLVLTDPGGETPVVLDSPAYTAAGDPRELGVVLSDVVATPLEAAPGFTLPVRSIFLVTLPLIGWLLLTRLGVAAGPAFAAGILLAGVAAWAAAAPTMAGYWLPTLGWPWWPAVPLGVLAFAPAIGHALSRVRARIAGTPQIGWAGLALAFAALLGMRFGLGPLVGMAVLVVGVWLALATLGDAAGLASVLHAPLSRRTVGVALLLIVGVALFLRFVNLDGQPAGLWRDESRHGLQALQIWEDPAYRPIYVVAGADLPALLFYLMAPVVGLLGPEVWSVRLVSAVIGALTPLALYWAVAPLIGRRAALIGAALLAVASWGLSMSRWAFPATLDHFLVLSAVGFLWRGIVRSSQPSALSPQPSTLSRQPSALSPQPSVVSLVYLALSGLLGGLATYAYHTGRMAPIALAVVAIIALGRYWPAWRRALPGLVLAAVVGLLTMAPLLFYIANDLEGYNRRVGHVSVFDSDDLSTQTPLGLLLRNVQRYALMWHGEGERNGRHHMPEAPMLDPVAGLLLAVGLGLALPGARRSAPFAALLALWAVYFVPGIFSGSAPHAMRSLGTLAPACALAGIGLVALESRTRSSVFSLQLSAFSLVFCLLFNAWLYFGVMAHEPRVYGEFDLQETAAARIVRAGVAEGVAVYLPERMAASDTVLFLTHRTPPRVFTAGAELPAGPALILLPIKAAPADQAAALAALGPEGALLSGGPQTPGGAPLLLAFGRGVEAEAVCCGATKSRRSIPLMLLR